MENLIKLKPRIFAHCSLFRARSFNCNHKKWPCLSARPGNPIIQPERRISTWISTGALSNCKDLDFDKTFPPMRYRVHPDKSLRCFATSDVAYTHIHTRETKEFSNARHSRRNRRRKFFERNSTAMRLQECIVAKINRMACLEIIVTTQ